MFVCVCVCVCGRTCVHAYVYSYVCVYCQMVSPINNRTSAPLAPQRGKKMFKFHEPGKFQRLAQTMRAKAQLERLQGEIASTARKTGISSATKLALIAPSKEVYDDRVPDVEWWDAAILPTGR